MRKLSLLFAAALFTGCIFGQEPEPPPEPLLPGGYKAVVDRTRPDPGQFSLAVVDTVDGVRFTTGPAGIAWRPNDVVQTPMVKVEGVFHLYGAPVGYREGYGIFLGGRDLETAEPEYAYLMVRGNGDFTIRRRRGSETETVVDWTSHAAVQRVSEDGEEPVNTLAAIIRGPDAEFLVNGTVVFRMPTGDVDPLGFAGVRINHRLDVGLTAWSLGPPPRPDAPGAPSGS